MKRKIKEGHSLAFLSHDINDLEHSKQAKLPRVTVVMPLKGFGEHNLHNWRSQVQFFCQDILLIFVRYNLVYVKEWCTLLNYFAHVVNHWI